MSAHSAKRPEPVLTRAGIVTVIAVLSSLLVHLGLGDVASFLDSYADPLAAVLLAVAPLYSAVLARRHVTAVADPVDSDGNKLVPAGSPLDVSSALSADEVAAIASALSPTA